MLSVVSVNVETPVTERSSSTVTVPPAESRVKLPVDVSISLSPATPIRTLSIVAPPFASTAPVNVEAPPTIKSESIPAVPTTSKPYLTVPV